MGNEERQTFRQSLHPPPPDSIPRRIPLFLFLSLTFSLLSALLHFRQFLFVFVFILKKLVVNQLSYSDQYFGCTVQNTASQPIFGRYRTLILLSQGEKRAHHFQTVKLFTKVTFSYVAPPCQSSVSQLLSIRYQSALTIGRMA